MRKTHKDEENKKMLKLYREYRETWDKRKDHGTWVEVAPYQKGWVRFYTLREDARNRNDANRLRRVLELVNSQIYCSRQDFTRAEWKGGKRRSSNRVPINQPLQHLTEKKYNELPQEIRKYFVQKTWTEKRNFPTKHYVTVTGYVPTTPEYFVFQVEPNIITHHYVPDGEWESRIAEVTQKIKRENLWPKINKALSKSMYGGYRYSYSEVYAKNKNGQFFTEEDLEYNDE